MNNYIDSIENHQTICYSLHTSLLAVVRVRKNFLYSAEREREREKWREMNKQTMEAVYYEQLVSIIIYFFPIHQPPRQRQRERERASCSASNHLYVQCNGICTRAKKRKQSKGICYFLLKTAKFPFGVYTIGLEYYSSRF